MDSAPTTAPQPKPVDPPNTPALTHKRSDRWPTVRHNHLLKHGFCRKCGGVLHLEVHHVKPFHLFPELELDEKNLITLCENPGTNCHLHTGHLGDWHKFNPNVRHDAPLRIAAAK